MVFSPKGKAFFLRQANSPGGLMKFTKLLIPLILSTASLSAGNFSDSSGRVHAQDPKPTIPHINAPPLITASEFNTIKDKTLNKANQLFSDIESWKSLTVKEKTDFCFRVLKTLAKDKDQTSENAIEEFLVNLNTNIRSRFFNKDQMNNIFKLEDYMMLGLGFLSIKKRNPDDNTARLFLFDIISESVSSGSTKHPIKGSLGEELNQSVLNGKKLLARYALIRDKHCPQVK
jgi:hypothetical protein